MSKSNQHRSKCRRATTARYCKKKEEQGDAPFRTAIILVFLRCLDVRLTKCLEIATAIYRRVRIPIPVLKL